MRQIREEHIMFPLVLSQLNDKAYLAKVLMNELPVQRLPAWDWMFLVISVVMV